jgi:GNAT superfamily N-acetyltransferase
MPALQLSNGIETFQSGASIRKYRTDDRELVFRLLSFLPDLYPQSFDWLERRLWDVERRHAHCSIAVIDHRISGILIDTPKGIRTSKISTLFVSEQACRNGLGSLLLNASTKRWHMRGIDSVYVTVAIQRQHSIDAFLRTNGFTESANLPDRYGPDRSELVYSLKLN